MTFTLGLKQNQGKKWTLLGEVLANVGFTIDNTINY